MIRVCILVLVVTAEASMPVSGPRPATTAHFRGLKRMPADSKLWAGHAQRLRGGDPSQGVTVNFQVDLGEDKKDVDVYVVGSTDSLGSWRFETTSPMTKCSLDGVEVYSKQVQVHRGEQLEFKFLTVSKEDKVEAWESIENRQLVIDCDSVRGTVHSSFDNPKAKVQFISMEQVGAALMPEMHKKATAPLKRGDVPPQGSLTPLNPMAQVSEQLIGAAAEALRSAAAGSVSAVTSAVTIGAKKIGSVAVAGAEKMDSAAKISAGKIGAAAGVSIERVGSVAETIGSVAMVGAEKVGSAAKISAGKIGAAAVVSIERVGSVVSVERVGSGFQDMMRAVFSVSRHISRRARGAVVSAAKALITCAHKVQQLPSAVESAAHIAKDVAAVVASEARNTGTLLLSKVRERRIAVKLDSKSVGALGGLGLFALAALQPSSNHDNTPPIKETNPPTSKAGNPFVSVSALSLMMGGILRGAKHTAKQELEVQGAITAKTLGGVTAGSVIVGSALRSASLATKSLVGRGGRTGSLPAAGAINTAAAKATGSGVSRFVQESMSAASGVARAASAGTSSYLDQVNTRTKMGHVASYLEQLESQRIVSRAATYLDQLEIHTRSSQTLSRAADAARYAGSAMEERAVAVVKQSAPKLVPKAAESKVAGGALKSIIKGLINKIGATGFKENVKRFVRFLLRLKFKA